MVLCAFRYVEESAVTLQQRSDTLRLTAAQSQDKVLGLEQQKVSDVSDVILVRDQRGVLT